MSFEVEDFYPPESPTSEDHSSPEQHELFRGDLGFM